jgi:membrane-bound lytic murein transglycosylase D
MQEKSVSREQTLKGKSPFYKLGGLGLLVVLITIMCFSVHEEPKPGSPQFDGTYSVYPVAIPDTLDFAGERVPLENFDTRESLDREFLVNTYWQSQTLLFLKRANRFFPVIEPILAKHGVPDDFKYLALAESGLMNEVSPAGAAGFWQIMRATATDYRLEITEEIDERYHLEKATEAACKFLNESYSLYKSWTMAAASYNMGRAGLNRQVSRQKTDYYYDLHLNDETSRYVFRVLAIKTIVSDPSRFGFHISPADLYRPIVTREVKVDTTITNLVNFAFHFDTNYKMLRYLNPWLRGNSLTNRSRKTYTIKIPEPRSRFYHEHLEDKEVEDFEFEIKELE